MTSRPEDEVLEVWGRERPHLRGFRKRLRTSIRTKLTVSHVLVVTMSTFIYAAGGFAVLMLLYFWSGTSLSEMSRQIPALFAITVFVLINIFLVTMCGIAAASIVSWFMARRLTRQIHELEGATDEFARGHLDRRATVMSQDEMGRLAERFNELAERLQELDHQRRSFVANISHDLRTPIAIIRGHLDAQLREDRIEPGDTDGLERAIEPIEAFRVIDHETQTLSKLIDDLFILSRLEEAALQIELSPVDLVDLIEGAVRGIRPYALRQARVSVNALVPVDLPPVMGDTTRITQVVNNLIHNAVRHTPAGGVVIVAAESLPNMEVVEVTVRDTGVGIAPDEVPRIFDRFYQGESTRAPGGTGLGLSIVKQLVEGQGGSVAVESQLGEGTAISFRLPMA
ncbi:MAG TPA: ATP-binding protein [Thermomicrobiales bacterium]|nr:ATP-binding protein [Thermomicrobiales bacterium]